MSYCPYYDAFNEPYAGLNDMIETMNEWHKHFINEIRKCGPLHETDPSLPSLRLKVNLMMIVSLFFP